MSRENVTYTDAPPAADGMGTTELGRVVGPIAGRHRTMRVVSTPAEHVEWQRGRYLSGCYVATQYPPFDDPTTTED